MTCFQPIRKKFWQLVFEVLFLCCGPLNHVSYTVGCVFYDCHTTIGRQQSPQTVRLLLVYCRQNLNLDLLCLSSACQYPLLIIPSFKCPLYYISTNTNLILCPSIYPSELINQVLSVYNITCDHLMPLYLEFLA